MTSVIDIKNDGAMSVKIDVEGGAFAVQLFSYHAGIIEYILKNSVMNIVHSVKGNRSIY